MTKSSGENSVPGPRGYVVGVPLIVTVYDDGRVEYEVDLSEVVDEMPEQSENSHSVIVEDGKIVQADIDRRYSKGRVQMVDNPII